VAHAPPIDDDLVDRARDGDPEAWTLIYRRTHPRLAAYARRRLGCSHQADDAVSETMVRAMGSISRYRHTGAGLEGWLFGIARHVVLEAYRTRGRHEPSDPSALHALAAPAHREPHAVVLAADERRTVASAFGRLPHPDQQLLALRVVAGLGAEQVGAMTGRRAGAVRMAQSRALARLRGEYDGLSA
jgi:RNA polymerase sigma-70 factor (ECF subfamily)